MEWWQYLIILGGILVFILLLLPNLQRYGVEIFTGKITKIGSLFIKRKLPPKPLRVSFGNKIGFVFSGKGEIYRIHLGVVIETGEDSVLDNIKATLDNKHNFQFKLFFKFNEFLNGRIPEHSKNLPLIIEPPVTKEGLELQTINSKTFELSLKEHFLIIDLCFSNQKIIRKIIFKFDRYHKKGYESDRKTAQESGRPKVSELPLENI